MSISPITKSNEPKKLQNKLVNGLKTVRQTGDSYIADLNAADRRVVHRVADEYDDIRTFSEGEGRDRRS